MSESLDGGKAAELHVEAPVVMERAFRRWESTLERYKETSNDKYPPRSD